MERVLRYFPDLDAGKVAKFKAMKGVYEAWNARINVISRKDMDNFYVHHVLHSLAVASVFDFRPGCRIADVGCGGGFPSVPLAVMLPEVHFTGIDSIGKKITVLENVVKELGLDNVEAVNARVEQLPAEMKFDFVASRAVTAFPMFYRFVKGRIRKREDAAAVHAGSGEKLENGIIYLKGGDFNEELRAFPKASVKDISDLFEEDFFETKRIIYLPF